MTKGLIDRRVPAISSLDDRSTQTEMIKNQPNLRPNIVFILTDDHAAHSIGAYGSRCTRTI